MLRTIQRSISSTWLMAAEQMRSFFDRENANRSSRGSPIRPTLEVLEGRITPAGTINDWTGAVSNDWNNAANWSNGLPGQNSDVNFGFASSKNCTMSVSGGVTVDQLNLAGYTGTLTLNTSLTALNGSYINDGNIAQPNGTASAINCQGTFTWTGGTIGSQTNGSSNLTINKTGTLLKATIGGSGFTETLGDNLTIGSWTTVTLTGESGNQLVTTNSANINNQGILNLNAGSKGINNQSGSNSSIINQATAAINVTGATGSNPLNCIPIVNNSDSWFTIGDSTGTKTQLYIKGTNPQNGVGFLNNDGVVNIYTGADLIANSGFTQQGGNLNIEGSAGIANLCNYGAGAGNVVINGGTIDFSSAYQWIESTLNFSVTGGSIILTIDATAGVENEIVSLTGNVSINNGTNVSVETVNIPPGGMPSRDWIIFEGADVTVGAKVIFGYSGWGYYMKGGNNSPDFYLQSYQP